MKRLLLLFVLLNFSNLMLAQGYVETLKVIATDPSLASWYGYDVSIQGDFAVVGAKNTQIESNAMGSVYILKKDSNGIWEEHQKLLAPDRRQFDGFGHSVAISGDYIVVGALGQDYNVSNNNFISAAGAAYIFSRDSNDNWLFQQKIIASDRTEIAYFGYSVDLSEDTIVIGAGRDDYDINGDNFIDEAGAAYFFEKDVNGVWNEVVKVTAPIRNTDDRFGYAVSVLGDYATVGAYNEDEDENETDTVVNAGAVYVFKRDANEDWNFQQKLVPSVRPDNNEYLGWSLDMDGDFIVAGAIAADEPNSSNGSVYIFKRDANDTWDQVDKLIAQDGVQGENFGYDVAIQDDHILVGAYQDYLITNGAQNIHGSIYFYLKDTTVDTWSFQQKILASNWQNPDLNNFGISVDLDGNDAIVGNWKSNEVNPDTNETFNEAGAAFILEFDPNLVILGVDNYNSNLKVQAYPNPVKNTLNLNLGEYHNVVNVTIKNVLGQNIFSKTYTNTSILQLEFNQPKGMYLVEVKTNKGTASIIKVLKQ